MAGLMGAGRTELAETLFGVRRMLTGKLVIDGKPDRHPQAGGRDSPRASF